jgi:diacylglycerol kinase (ATP)
MRTVVIYNPTAGRGRAGRIRAEARRRLPAGAELIPTERGGHAAALAKDAATTGAVRVVAAGGDGTVHEVANGLVQSGNADAVLGIWPLGSMNDYAFTLGLDAWWRAELGGEVLKVAPADVGVVRGGGRELFFVNSAGLGFNGLVSAEARTIRWLRGLPLYTLAVLRGLRKHFRAEPLNLSFDGRRESVSTLALSLGIAQREGGFPLTPAAKFDDGLFDWLWVGAVSRYRLLRSFPGMMTGKLPLWHEKLRAGRCRSLGVIAESPLCIHADGELFCLPLDGVLQAEFELLPGRLNVETYPKALYGSGKYEHLAGRYAAL